MASRLLGVLVALAVATGCTGVPSQSGAQVVRRVPAEDPGAPEPRVSRRLPPPPPDARPDEIVRSYLIAQNDPGDDYAVARRYLAPQAEWVTEGRAVVYASRSLRPPRVSGDRASVAVRLAPVGAISPSGEFRSVSAPVDVTFRLRLVSGVGWRLVDPPAGLLVGREEVGTSFHRVTLYWPDQARRLAPDVVFLRANEQPVTAIVRALLAGPRGWLAPAVRTAIPKGTELLGPPDINERVVTLNFSREIRFVPQETLGTLVAQVVWTLTEQPDVEAVRLLSEGVPLPLPAPPGVRPYRRADWEAFAPVPPTADRRLFFVMNGAPYAVDDDGRRSRVADTPPLESYAVNRAGTTLAGVTRAADGRQALVFVDLTGAEPPRFAHSADRMSAPTWEPGGDVVWVVQSTGPAQQVVAVPAARGVYTVVRAPTSLPGPLTSLRLSPDGARAAIVTGSGRAASVWLARVERPASGGRLLGEPRRVVPGVRGATAVAFDGPGALLFATLAGRRPALYRAGVDGYGVEPVRDAGLPAGPITALAVSAGASLDRVALSGGRLWRRTPGADWAALSWKAGAPAFAG
ncbi:MAG TPA: LpqB family beta-propeller domain-containing protein [Frankiaceae bacterium]|nr:LpqB family beta-propeller domain-containing protein [Frankiaceae bacterium]